MKKIALALFVVLTSFQSYAFEMIDLPNGRTSMEYGPQVRDFVNKVENYKWEAENGEAFHFVQAAKPYEDEFVNQNVYLTVNSFLYGDKTAERLMYVVQSEYVGYLDLIDHETSQVIPIRYLSGGEIETIQSSSETMVFSKVKEWSTDPDPVESYGTAEDRGAFF